MWLNKLIHGEETISWEDYFQMYTNANRGGNNVSLSKHGLHILTTTQSIV